MAGKSQRKKNVLSNL